MRQGHHGSQINLLQGSHWRTESRQSPQHPVALPDAGHVAVLLHAMQRLEKPGNHPRPEALVFSVHATLSHDLSHHGFSGDGFGGVSEYFAAQPAHLTGDEPLGPALSGMLAKDCSRINVRIEQPKDSIDMNQMGAGLSGLRLKRLRQTKEFRALRGQTADDKGIAHRVRMTKA
jgi:hypothetical protein